MKRILSIAMFVVLAVGTVAAQESFDLALVFGPRAEDVVVVKVVARQDGKFHVLGDPPPVGDDRLRAALMIAWATRIINPVTLTPSERAKCLSQKICMCCQ